MKEVCKNGLKTMKDCIIIALDVASEKEAIDLVLKLKDRVGYFKIGLELLNSVGIHIVRDILDVGGKVFLDGKFMDIPNTVAGASKAVTRLGVCMFNIHTLGGLEMMKRAFNASREEASRIGREHPLVLGVTVLTSIDQAKMNLEMGVPGSIEHQVVHLAEMAQQAGLDGVVASPQEIEAIRKNVSNNMIIVTPGVRPVWSAIQDQKRIMTPSEAINRGASYLVIGRPITNPPPEIGTPIDAADLVLQEINSAGTTE